MPPASLARDRRKPWPRPEPRVRATKEEAAELTTGTWYVSALATGEDGDTTFVPQAAAFEVTR
ncbi:hypothetical protein [Streptomyces africanus]|uniref:hypothetical protein n=1 Tax=Streptomyces africanus TaxID=231024 RepID=UPI0027D8E8FB|nr:hypothetical protein [Streptomyces africanus]